MELALGEINVDVQPLFTDILNANLVIRIEDLIMAAITENSHINTLEKVMEAISNAVITLNPEECVFLDLKLGLAKLMVFKYLTPSTNKAELLEN